MAHTILVADDSKTIRRAIEIAFEKEPFELAFAQTGDEAIAKAKQVMPSLVLADHVMPGKDGYEVAQALKGDPTTAQIPVLLLSGSAAPFDEGKCSSSGAAGHIKKPFECAQLIDRVREAVGAEAGPDAMPSRAPLQPVTSSPAPTPVAASPAPAPTPAAPTSRPDPFGLGVPSAPSSPPGVSNPTPAPSPAPVAAPMAASVQASAEQLVEQQVSAAGVPSTEAVNAATREIIERVVWEVVPELAETLIREEIQRLLQDR